MSRHQKRIESARSLRDRLKAEGREDDARIVDDLTRSSAVSLGLNRRAAEDAAYAAERFRIVTLERDAAIRAARKGEANS